MRTKEQDIYMQTTSLKGAHLSLQQTRLWLFQQKSRAYHVQGIIKVEGKFNRVLWLQSLHYMIERHEILRTTFRRLPGMDVPMQIINGDSRLTFPIIDVDGLDTMDRTEQLHACFAHIQKAAHGSEYQHVLSMALLKTSPGVHFLLLALSALCADASTLKLLIVETYRVY